VEAVPDSKPYIVSNVLDSTPSRTRLHCTAKLQKPSSFPTVPILDSTIGRFFQL
jgi:hypothetical protein